MTIQYKEDHILKYKPDILKGLVSYNVKFAGKPFEDAAHLYVFEQNELVGGCVVEVGWNWLYFESIVFKSQAVLNEIICTLKNKYQDKTEGFAFETYLEHEIKAFESAGFVLNGVLEDKPKGFDSHFMIHTSNTILESNDTYKLVVSKEKDESHETTYTEMLKDDRKKYHVINEKTDLEFAAFDGEKVIGGVYGYLQQDYLYVSLLWVDESYRGKDIASKLMALIEEDAQQRGYQNAYLGTCTFQAQGFYIKREYENKMIFHNCPEGYDDFMMTKKL